MIFTLCFFCCFSGIEFDGNTLGIANIGSMCLPFSVGLTRDGGYSMYYAFTTAAHEMGHNFNMMHDDGMIVEARFFYIMIAPHEQQENIRHTVFQCLCGAIFVWVSLLCNVIILNT